MLEMMSTLPLLQALKTELMLAEWTLHLETTTILLDLHMAFGTLSTISTDVLEGHVLVGLEFAFSEMLEF